MVCPLIVVHLAEQGWNRWPVDEPNVPVLVLIDAGAQIARCSHLMNDFILSVTYVDNELWFRRLLIRSELCFLLRRGRARGISFRWRLFLDGFGLLLEALQVRGQQSCFVLDRRLCLFCSGAFSGLY